MAREGAADVCDDGPGSSVVGQDDLLPRWGNVDIDRSPSPPTVLSRADSGHSSSSASDRESLSSCSSYFKGGEWERRSSFASSVCEEDLKHLSLEAKQQQYHRQQQQQQQQQYQLQQQESNSAFNLLTPTAEIRAFIPPSSPSPSSMSTTTLLEPASSSIASPSSSLPPAVADHAGQHPAPASAGSPPSSSSTTTITSSTHFWQIPPSSTASSPSPCNTPSSKATPTTKRQHARTIKKTSAQSSWTEGFPWTARPSSASVHASLSVPMATPRSRVYSSSSINDDSSKSLIATPSAIFSSHFTSDDDDESASPSHVSSEGDDEDDEPPHGRGQGQSLGQSANSSQRPIGTTTKTQGAADGTSHTTPSLLRSPSHSGSMTATTVFEEDEEDGDDGSRRIQGNAHAADGEDSSDDRPPRDASARHKSSLTAVNGSTTTTAAQDKSAAWGSNHSSRSSSSSHQSNPFSVAPLYTAASALFPASESISSASSSSGFPASSSSMGSPAVSSYTHAHAMLPSMPGGSRGRHYSLDDTKAWAADSSSTASQEPHYLSSSATTSSFLPPSSSSTSIAPFMHAARSYSGSTFHRPSTASSTLTSSSTTSRPWVKDSDASSVRSGSGLSSDGSSQDEDKLSVMSPAAPPPVPFLSTRPQPAGCRISVDASATDRFVVVATLPGFSLENITLALKRNGSLHILADRYDDGTKSPLGTADDNSSNNNNNEASYGGHFERMVELGESAIGAKVSAEFDGKRLKVTVLKRDHAGGAGKRPNTAGIGVGGLGSPRF